LEQFGLQLVKFFVTSVNTPESDPAVARLKGALAKRAEMSILGYTYQQERSFDTLETAAGNPGSMQSGLMGAGIGIGMGAGIGSAIAPAMAPVVQNLQPTPVTCPNCRAIAAPNSAFCANCGTRMAPPPRAETVCTGCGRGISAEAKFCPECGKSRAPRCTACGNELAPGSKFCLQCGVQV
jgi:membrane protease subunit (stomatin/prohibitin family)